MNRYEVSFIHRNGERGRTQVCAETVHAALDKVQTAFDNIIKPGSLAARLVTEGTG